MVGRRQFLAGALYSAGGLASSAALRPTQATTKLQRGVLFTPQMLDDALVGATYLGCGGGGRLEEGRRLIAEDLAAGLSFRVMNVEDLADDERVACPYALGSLAAPSPAMQARLNALDAPSQTPVEASFRLLERHLETRFAGVIMGEIGPGSLADGLSTAARLGVPALDADTVGRAVPEINQHSVRVAGLSLVPAAGATPFGDEIVVTKIGDPSREEALFRALAVASYVVGVTDAPITGRQARQSGVLVTDSLSLARNIGQGVRAAKTIGVDPIEAARQVGGGFHLFDGTIIAFSETDADGFLAGSVRVEGTGAYAGQTLVLEFKNEHLIARRDGRVIATCPDLITLIDRETAIGIGNPDFEKGQAVSVLGFPADPLWRTEAGLNVFSPRYFGYDLEYIPIEDRLGP